MDNDPQEPEVATCGVPPPNRTRSLHVKRVPWSIWARARQNALQSGIPFREFVIALLAKSGPLQVENDSKHDADANSG